MKNKPKQLNNYSLTGQFEQVANQINQNLPRKQPQQAPMQQVQQPAQPNIAIPNNYQPKAPEDPMVSKLRKWMLIGLSAIVAGSAILLIIWRVILKFVR